MSQESMEWLNENILIGFTDKRGEAWWKDDRYDGFQNHFPGPIPVDKAVEFFRRWEPVEADLFFFDRNGKPRGDSQAAKTVYRSQPGSKYDYVRLGNHESGWAHHDREGWLIDNVANLIDTARGDLGIASVGELRMGKVAWVQIEAPDTITHSSGFSYRPFIAATTSFDGTIATTYKSGEIAVVCDNTHAGFFRGKEGQYKVKHTRHSSVRIADAREALDIIFRNADAFDHALDELSSKRVTDDQWEKFLEIYVPARDDAGKRGATLAQNKRLALSDLYFTDPRVAPWQGTALGVLQATNTYDHHLSIVRNTPSRVERQWSNFLDGTTEDATEKTLAALAKATA